MRTTVEFDDDTSRAIEALRRARGWSVSEAVNELIRRGLQTQSVRPPFLQRTAPLSVTTDVSSVADALEVLDGGAGR